MGPKSRQPKPIYTKHAERGIETTGCNHKSQANQSREENRIMFMRSNREEKETTIKEEEEEKEKNPSS
jgi:hypothetical protein